MVVIHDDSSFKMALISEDLQGDQTKASFAKVCEEAMQAMSAHEIGSDFQRVYNRLAGDPEQFYRQVKSDLWDNYMIGGFVLMRSDIPESTPLIAWASLNRMEFPGLHGEISLMRALMWGGFDPSATTNGQERGITALHAMCSLKYGDGVHVRAIEHLIEGGANVNAVTEAGDTPLITLCGHTGWNDEMSNAFKVLYNAGADADQKEDDGPSAWQLLNTLEKQHPHPIRAALIAEVAP